MNRISGKIINHDKSFIGSIEFDEKIITVNKSDNLNTNNIIIPGFFDLHCHGGNGFDAMEGLDSIINMSKYHLQNGTTSLLPTTLTASNEDTIKALKGVREFINNKNNSSNILGIHLEGPFINPNKLGAQPPFAQLPSINFIKKLQQLTILKIVTIAPELDGAEDCIKYLIDNNIKVQFGHSLADYSCCLKIMKKNSIGFTHLYNAMSGCDHRKPGVLEAALNHADFAEIICDFNHVDEANIKLANKCIPKLYAISDSISATGKPDGNYKFGNLKITKKNGKALINSNILAGSIINMHDTFKNLIKINFTLEKAVAMTSFNASQYILEKNLGKIEKNFIANIIVLDHELNIKEVYLKGKLVS